MHLPHSDDAPDAGQLSDEAPPLRLDDAARWVRKRLAAAGLSDAGREARRLTSEILNLAPGALIVSPDRPLAAADASALARATARRAAREPLSRIVGTRAFYGRDFQVSSAVLDPRPDSETIIDAALSWRNGRTVMAPRIADLGTGSGCLLLTLLAEWPDATGTGLDISSDALAVATANARGLGVAHRARFVEQDASALSLAGFDVVVSNPPYIRSGDIPGLDPEVRDHDPHLALDGGPDGLAFYRRVAAQLETLEDRALMIVEVGAAMAGPVSELFGAAIGPAGRHALETIRDLNDVERCVALRPL